MDNLDPQTNLAFGEEKKGGKKQRIGKTRRREKKRSRMVKAH